MTTEGHEIIKFMEKFRNESKYMFQIFSAEHNGQFERHHLVDGVVYPESKLPFKHDYNVLMDVVQTIAGIDYMIKINYAGCMIVNKNNNECMAESYDYDLRQAIYSAVEVFCEWYNKEE